MPIPHEETVMAGTGSGSEGPSPMHRKHTRNVGRYPDFPSWRFLISAKPLVLRDVFAIRLLIDSKRAKPGSPIACSIEMNDDCRSNSG